MSSIVVEIRAAEGGADAKLLVRDQFVVYVKLAERRGL
jgi:protein subunit release factor A